MRLPKIGRAELGLGAASLLLSLGILELGLRWIAGIDPLFYDNAGSQRILTPEHDDPQQNPFGFPLGMRVPKPGSDSWLVGKPVHVNAQGMRAPREYTLAKPPGTLRVMLIGDSVTWSNTSYEEGLADSLRRALAERRADVAVEVPSFACPSWSLPDYFIAIEQAARRFELDQLVVNFVMNDLPFGPQPLDVSLQRGPLDAGIDSHPYLRALLRHSALGTWMVWTTKGVFARRQVDPVLALLVESDVQIAQRADWMRPFLRALHAFQTERGVPVTVVLWPYAVQLDETLGRRAVAEWYQQPFDARYLERRPQAVLQRVCAEEGVFCLDPSPAFLAAPRVAPLFFATPEARIDYIHLSPEGHRVVAAWLAEQLASL